MLQIAILCVCIVLVMLNKKNKRKDFLFLRMYSTGCIIRILAIGFSLLSRLADYFSVAIIILLPNAINRIDNQVLKYVCFGATVLAGILYFGFYCQSDGAGIIPYEFFWQVF